MSARAFRLAGVLRVRHVQEELARAALAAGNRVVREAETVRDESAERYRTAPLTDGAVGAEQFLRERAGAELAAGSLVAAEATLHLARADVTRAFELWRVAAQRVEALQRLEQRQTAELIAADARKDAATVDELVTTRFVAEAGRVQP